MCQLTFVFCGPWKWWKNKMRTNSSQKKSASLRVEALRSWNCSNFETLLLWEMKHITMNQHAKTAPTPNSNFKFCKNRAFLSQETHQVWCLSTAQKCGKLKAPADSSHYIPSIHGILFNVVRSWVISAFCSTIFYILPFRSCKFPHFPPGCWHFRWSLVVAWGHLLWSCWETGTFSVNPATRGSQSQFCTWLGWYGRGDLKAKVDQESSSELVAYVGGLHSSWGIFHERIVRFFLGYLD